MTPTEHKEFVQEAWRAATPDIVEQYLLRLNSAEATIEDLRKAVELANRVTGAEADKKVDPNAGLAVFNFTFSNGGVSALPVVEISAPDVLDVTPRAPRAPRKKKPAALAADTAVKASSAPDAPEMSMDDMMAGLDEMLGDAE